MLEFVQCQATRKRALLTIIIPNSGKKRDWEEQ